jgi:broad specificity phosphatase PhoE
MPTDSKRPSELAVFRHAYTKKGASRGKGSHLSAEGVELARSVGSRLGRFDLVVTSPVPRAIETALAMGYAVDDVIEVTAGYVPGEFEHHQQWDWDLPYVRFAQLLASGDSKLAHNAAVDAERWRSLIAALPTGGRALVISHGGSIEPTLVACVPDADVAAWGGPFAHCDGVVLRFEGRRFCGLDWHRAAAPVP